MSGVPDEVWDHVKISHTSLAELGATDSPVRTFGCRDCHAQAQYDVETGTVWGSAVSKECES